MRVVKFPADVLPNPRRYQPDYALTINIATHFTPNNTLIFIGTHQNNSAQTATSTEVPIPSLDSTEAIYGTPFHNAEITDELLTFWMYSPEWDTIDPGLALAGDNSFIPHNFTIHPAPSESEPRRTEWASSETWVLLDTELFPQPRASFTCELRSGCNESSALREALSELFAALVTANLKPRLYGATEVGYTFTVESTGRGLTLTFAGLSDSDIFQQIISDTMQGES